MEFGYEEWLVDFEDHEIKVVNTWFNGARLYIDGECLDTTKQLFAFGEVILSATLPSTMQLVEVAMEVITEVKIKVFVDGEFVGGEIWSEFKYADYTLPDFAWLIVRLLAAYAIWFGCLIASLDFTFDKYPNLFGDEASWTFVVFLSIYAGILCVLMSKIFRVNMFPSDYGGPLGLAGLFFLIGAIRII